ncbi:TBCC domain-containing protein 1-like [Acanthaster planci]|uniref:TBCC domain-containing protein 1 n=1 Tax=Acanthaster planci TaxID=133434 RepID=A0A8B7YSP5_ACAPL|nr:TBCC domain-containing protein 1-like [Acanthaster planci]XP_022096314.1 TBCC domain-containing protein 1-like [Acanthaster planci]XP_022096315.1 TBCC domain-containing protein 1-like [Acanthaster planci]
MAVNASLWLKFDPFHIGALQVSPHPKLSLHYLRKIAVYAKTKGKAGFPQLSYPVWRHIAVNKLNISDDLAWMFFEGYDLLCECPAETRLKLAEKLQGCKTPQEKEFIKNQASVDTLEFLIYLFLQQVHKISLRSSLVSGEEWPMRPRSPDVDSRGGTINSKSLDENTHMTFLQTHLSDMLSLLVEADPYAGSATDVLMSLQSVQAMSFILEGCADGNRTVKPIHELAKTQGIQLKSGYSKITLAFTCRTFESWIRTSLVANPYGVAACISAGHRLSWPTAGGDGDAVKRGRMATNAQKAPSKNKLVILSQICKQTLAKSSSTLVNARVKVHRCHHSFIYLLSPLKFVSIEKCRHSTIVLGAVDTTVHLSGCEDTKVITACRRCSVSGSTLCTLHLLTPTRPLLLGGNDSITLAPYHTHYPMLQQHMAQVGLSEHPNDWDQPLCIGPDHQEDSPVYELMKPKDFFTFVVPFEMQGETTEIPGGLPARFERTLTERNRQIQGWLQMVKEAGLPTAKRKQFQTLVESRFQVWLEESGHKRELDSLVPAHASLAK